MSTHSLTCAHEALDVELTGQDAPGSRLITLRCRHCAACLGRSAPGLGYQTQRNWRAPFRLDGIKLSANGS